MMTLRPRAGLPLDIDLVAGSNGSAASSVGGVDVADDLVGGGFLGGHEAVREIGCLPADADGRIGVIWVLAREPASVGDTVDHDVGDIAVGGCLGCGGEEGNEERSSALHDYFTVGMFEGLVLMMIMAIYSWLLYLAFHQPRRSP
jgi:hypothetical protein